MGETAHNSDMDLVSGFYGFFLGLLVFTIVEVARQTWSIWKRTRRIANWYLAMIWVELIVNVIFATTTYMYLQGVIEPSLAYFVIVVILWTFQTQLLLQIIANRVGLIMVNKKKVRLLKWTLFGIILFINISVFCIWIPALLNVNPTFVSLNHIWERVEKTIFLLVDFALNSYFLYLVRSKLIARGLTKYWRLFRVNAALIVISIITDALLLGMLSLPNTYAYVQFAPVVYTIKLNIELSMAVLISKVVRSSERVDLGYSHSNDASNPTRLTNRVKSAVSKGTVENSFPGLGKGESTNTCERNAESEWPTCVCADYGSEGIMKTTMTTVVTTKTAGDGESCSSSTRQLREDSIP